VQKAQDDTEKLLKIAELLSLKGNTRGHRDELVNEILKVHTRFTARVGEYRFLLNMAEKFFNNLSQVLLLFHCIHCALSLAAHRRSVL